MNTRAASLQERILGLLAKQGSVLAKEIALFLPDYDRIGLDVALGALMKGAKVSLICGRYELTEYGRKNPTPIEPPAGPPVNWPKPKPAPPEKPKPAPSPPAPRLEKRRVPEPPTAAEEAASTLNGEQRTCRGKCGQTKPIDQFHKNPSCPGGRDTTCKRCRHDRKVELRQHADTATSSGPEPGSPTAARDASASVPPRDEAQRATPSATAADAPPSRATDSAERRSDRGTEKAAPPVETPEPEKGDRQPSAEALGKAPPAQATWGESAAGCSREEGAPRAEPPGAPEVLMPTRQGGVDSSAKSAATQSRTTVSVLAHARERRKMILLQLKVLADELEQLDRFEDLCRKFKVDEESGA